MIYRIIVDACLEGVSSGRARWGGLTNSHLLSRLLDEFGISSPTVDRAQARFYFTASDWRRAGKNLASQAWKSGHAVRVIRRKKPSQSQVVYRDPWQVAFLPRR